MTSEQRADLRGKLIGINGLLRNALVATDTELALRLCGAMELTADALALVESATPDPARLTQVEEGKTIGSATDSSSSSSSLVAGAAQQEALAERLAVHLAACPGKWGFHEASESCALCDDLMAAIDVIRGAGRAASLDLTVAENDWLREVIASARDTLAAFQKQAGWLSEQGGYSTRVTEPEMQLARMIADLDRILATPSEAGRAASPDLSALKNENDARQSSSEKASNMGISAIPTETAPCTCTPVTAAGVMVQHPHCPAHGTPVIRFSTEPEGWR